MIKMVNILVGEEEISSNSEVDMRKYVLNAQ